MKDKAIKKSDTSILTVHSGRNRMRRRIEIRKWFLDNEITQRQIARETSVSHQLVCMVLAGTRKNEVVMSALVKYGFPVRLLVDITTDDA